MIINGLVSKRATWCLSYMAEEQHYAVRAQYSNILSGQPDCESVTVALRKQ